MRRWVRRGGCAHSRDVAFTIAPMPRTPSGWGGPRSGGAARDAHSCTPHPRRRPWTTAAGRVDHRRGVRRCVMELLVPEPEPVEADHLASVRARRAELRESMNALEQALAGAGPGRIEPWAERVHVALVGLSAD